MTAKELSEVIGKTATYATGSLSFEVIVTDTKMSYGHIRYEIKPKSGSGTAWVETLIFDN